MLIRTFFMPSLLGFEFEHGNICGSIYNSYAILDVYTDRKYTIVCLYQECL